MNDDRLTGPGAERSDPPGRFLTESEVQELLPGFVLGALEPDEMLAVEAFLQEHPAWQERLLSLEQAATGLAHAALRAPLPAGVKDRLLIQARADAPIEPPVREPEPAALPRRAKIFGAAPATPAQRRNPRGLRPIPPAQPRPATTSLNWFGIFWRSVATAGALAAILLLAGLTWQLRNNVTQLSTQIVDLQGRLAEAQRANEELQQINGSLQQQLQQQARRVAILTNPDQSITLAATDPLMAANGNFYRLGEEAVLVLRGLEPLPEGQTYQLWLLPPGGGASIPADLIEVADSSTQTVTVAVAPEYTNLTGVGVSIEPAGGSLEPTTIVLLGTEPVPSA